MRMSTQIKLGIGSVLSTFGALGIVLSLILEWTALPRPWGFLLGFVLGVATGLGVLLSIRGLIEYRGQF
jgi:predicted ABC-type sugar transport system permease subunit